MPRPRNGSSRVARLGVGGLAVAALLTLVAGGGAAGPGGSEARGAAGWQGLLGSRPATELGGRWIVVFRAPSLADFVRGAKVPASEEQERRWTARARAMQDRFLARLAADGAGLAPEQRYVRVLNGIAAALDPRVLPVLESEPFVLGVYPVRAAYPASTTATPVGVGAAVDLGNQPEVRIPGRRGDGVEIALLDTGVDLTHPYLAGRLLPGIDIVDPGGDASARQNPTERGRAERHGTELAGIVVGAGGPGGLTGVAPRASVRPIRVAGWQPDGAGGVAVYARTDQLVAGLEAAVDPNGDGDSRDAARIALVGVVEPFGSFEDAPVIRAAGGAAALDTLVVAAAGNDGPAGPTYGSVGAPAGAAAALAVSSVDARASVPTAHVLLSSGLGVLFSGHQALGGSGRPGDALDLRVVALGRSTATAVSSRSGLDRLFDSKGYSRVAGAAALLPSGPPTPETVRDLAQAGARAVVVDGPVPAGALGVDDPEQLPIIGIPSSVATTVRRSLREGEPVTLAVGSAARVVNDDRSRPAPFSSDGLAFDGSPKPDLAAPGVGIVTSAPGRNPGGTARYDSVSGTSAAAAVVAGAAALLVQARPELGATALRSALRGSARAVSSGPGTSYGLVDPAAAATVELVSDPPTLGLGVAPGPGAVFGKGFTLRNTSRRLIVAQLSAGARAGGTTASVFPREVALEPGESAPIGVSVQVDTLPAAPSAIAGSVVVTTTEGSELRVPWAIAVPTVGKPLLERASVTPPSFRPSDTSPAVLTFTAGRVDGPAERPALLPLAWVEVRLRHGNRLLGTLIRLRDVLPGRFALGITGRGPKGARLGPGDYTLRIVTRPVTGYEEESIDVPFSVERP